MLKKTITYEDLDENEITDIFYFNLNAPELGKLQNSREGGLMAYLQDMIQAEDGAALLGGFSTIITSAYGERSEDGKRLVKSPEISEAFTQTDAFSSLFEEFLTNPTSMAEFMEAIIPMKLAKKLQAQAEVTKTEPREHTREELLRMPQEEFDALVGTDTKKMTRPNLVIHTQRLMARKNKPSLPMPDPRPLRSSSFTTTELLAMSNAEFDEVAGTDLDDMSEDLLHVAITRSNRE